MTFLGWALARLTRSCSSTSAVFVILYAFLQVQGLLPINPAGQGAIEPVLAPQRGEANGLAVDLVSTHLREVWEQMTDPQYLRVYIRQLRGKSEPVPGQPRCILTETGVGYRLVPKIDGRRC